MKKLTLVLFLLISGCSAHLGGSGKSTDPPDGFSKLCEDTPTFPACQK